MDEITVTEPRPVAPGISGNDLASLLGGAQQAEQAIKAREASNKKVAGEVRTGLTTVQDQLKSLTEQHNKDKAALGSLPNLQSEKFKAPDEVDPVQSFGSFASMLAMAGSLMTRAPLTTALRASAAGMNAIKQNNADAFDKAFEVWKANSDAALKQANFELEKYGVASQMMNTDYAQGVALARTQASLIQDHVALAALESPDPKDYIDLMASRQAAVLGLAKAMPELEQAGLQFKLYSDWGKNNPKATDEQKIQKYNEIFSPRAMGTQTAPIDPNDPNDSAYIDAIGNYQLKGPTPGRNPALYQRTKEAVLARYPDYTEGLFDQSQKAFRDFGTGRQGDIARSLNVAVSHLETIKELSSALQNGNVPAFNAVAQRWAQETGQPAPTNFDSAKLIVGPEIMKAIVGPTALADREEARLLFDRAKSPDQLAGAANTVEQLMGGQLRGLADQYKRTTHRNDFYKSFLNDATRRALGDEQTSATPKGAEGDGGPAPEGVDPTLWQHMTPEERKLWQTN